jgi:hypothetical protein
MRAMSVVDEAQPRICYTDIQDIGVMVSGVKRAIPPTYQQKKTGLKSCDI